MNKKSKYNPSKKPVLTKSSKNKGAFLKNLEAYRKKLNRFRIK